jgi:hypothetical protein
VSSWRTEPWNAAKQAFKHSIARLDRRGACEKATSEHAPRADEDVGVAGDNAFETKEVVVLA